MQNYIPVSGLYILIFCGRFSNYFANTLMSSIYIIIAILSFTPSEFFTWALVDGLSLAFESPQVSRNLLANLNRVVVWMVSTRPVISKSSSLFNNPYNWCKCHFHVPQFFQIPSKVGVLILLLLSFNFTRWSAETTKSTILKVLFLLLIFTRSGPLADIRWSVCVPKSHWSLDVSFSWTDTGLCKYH